MIDNNLRNVLIVYILLVFLLLRNYPDLIQQERISMLSSLLIIMAVITYFTSVYFGFY